MMNSMFRYLKILPAALALPLLSWAQEASPSPDASPSPAGTPEASPSPLANPEQAVQPEAAASPAAQPAASPTEDVIPMPDGGLPVDSPLDTPPLVPTDPAMPDAAFTDPNAIIPDDVAPPAPTFGPQGESEGEIARYTDVRYREMRIRAQKDPSVVSLQDQADKARSDEDKRAALREYYRLLYKRMIDLDKSLEPSYKVSASAKVLHAAFVAQCQSMESAYLRRLAQYRLEPTIPLHPPPTPEPLN